MLALAFAWWKSISGKGIVSLSCPIVRVEATIQSGRSYLAIVSGANGWEGYGFYSPGDGRATVFRGTIDDMLKGRHRVAVSIPFWFLAVVVSLVFLALFLIQRRRMWIWERGLPGDLTNSEIE